VKRESREFGYVIRLCVISGIVLAALSCATSHRGPKAFASVRRVDFEAADGRVAIRLEPRGESIRVEGRGGIVLATIRADAERLVVEDAHGRAIWFIESPGPQERRIRVRTPGDEGVAFEVKRDPDGDLEVRDEYGRRTLVAKRRAYGYKIVSGEGEAVARVRARPGKISVRNRSGTTYLSTRDEIPVEAVALLMMETLPIEAAAGLGVAVAFWIPQDAPTAPLDSESR